MAQWKPGESGNPAGRKRDAEIDKLRLALEGNLSKANEVIAQLIAGDGIVKPETQLKAVQLLWDRYYGKATSVIELSAPDGEPLRVEMSHVQKLPIKDLRQLKTILEKAKAKKEASEET